MIERSKNLGLTLKPGNAIGILQKRSRQQFERYLAFERRVERPIDFAHAALPDQRCGPVVTDLFTRGE
jgi:hypothetical protein